MPWTPEPESNEKHMLSRYSKFGIWMVHGFRANAQSGRSSGRGKELIGKTICGARLGLALIASSLTLLFAISLAAASSSSAEVPVAISAGGDSTCVLISGGTAKCWGDNEYGQIGDGSTKTRLTPVEVKGLERATAISAGYFNACALIRGGTIKCWGYNYRGSLSKRTAKYDASPVAVKGISNAASLSVGYAHACAVIAGGRVQCWGDNVYGALGDGTTKRRLTPVSVVGIRDATMVSAGGFQSCALLRSGLIKCWGADNFGQLGNGPAPDSGTAQSLTPVQAQGVSNAVSVNITDDHSCAMRSNGTVICWGDNGIGQLGHGASGPTLSDVSGITNATAITSRVSRSCALLVGGSISCWGDNHYAELGDGTRTDRQIPVSVSGIRTAYQVTTGGIHTCALLFGGTIKCWGWNKKGQLGSGTTKHSPTPITVRGFTAAPTVFGVSATVQPVSGTVRIKPPGATKYIPLTSARSVPLKTLIDTTSGTVEITTATGSASGKHRAQTARFSEGAFKLTQHRERSKRKRGRRVGFTDLTLRGGTPTDCNAGASSIFFAKKGKKRKNGKLWGNGHGNYKTNGEYASGTVRGTKWLTENTCEGTRITVARGVVRVFDKVKKKTVDVKAGRSYLAKAPQS